MRDCDRRLDQGSTRTRLQQRFGKRTAAPRPHQFEVAQPGPSENLRARRVRNERLEKRVADALARSMILDADKIDNRRRDCEAGSAGQ
jgi:hypothetical protein